MRNLTQYGEALPSEPLSRPSPESIDWARIWTAIWRRRNLFVAISAGFVALVAVFTMLTPKTYTTTVRLIAGTPGQNNANSSTMLPVLNALVLQTGDQSAETLATLAQQEDVAATVTQNLNLKVSPNTLLSHLSVKPVSNTPILDLSVKWRDPSGSAKIANAFAEAFMWRERDFVRSQAISALTFLSAELPRAEATMRQTASDLANFQASKGFVDANSHTADIVSRASSLETKIEATKLDMREANALLNNTTEQLASMPQTVNTAQQISVNPVLQDLQAKLEAVDVQLQTARRQYTEQHPVVNSLEKQHEDLLAQIAQQPAQINSQNTLSPNPLYQSLLQQTAQYRQRIEGDKAQLSLLQQQHATMMPLIRQLPKQSMDYTTLQQRAKLAADVYNALAQKFNDATVAKSTAISDISIVQPATADSAVVRPNLKINLLAGLIIGLLIASTLVLILDSFHRSVQASVESGVLGLPVIGRIPAFDVSNRRALPWVQSMTVEAFLQLCVALKLKSKQPLHTLAITSPSRGDGKSTVAFNLAKAMSNLEQRVLLIDADLRKPVLHGFAGSSNNLGLSDVLQNLCTLGQAVCEISPTFHLLPAGHNVENPVALIQSSRFEDILTDQERRYSIIIVDTPALTAVTDGLVVSAKVDATAVVIASNLTNENDTREVLARFTALGINNLVGVVLNKDDKRFADYSDYFARSSRAALTGRTS